MRSALICGLILLLLAVTGPLWRAVAYEQSAVDAERPSNPEMDRLAAALSGDWETTEKMERSQFFPNGGSRRGEVHAHLAAGGSVLMYEVHSDGTAGKLDGFHAIWWDSKAKLYHFFACFNNPDRPCRMRGTAHWEGREFVNDYEETIDGRTTRWRDTFEFTATSHTLVAAMDTGNGTWKTFITTSAKLRHAR